MRAGVPEDEIESDAQACTTACDSMRTRLRTTNTLRFGTKPSWSLKRAALRIIHTPGHTPGSCSFLREADRTVIAGDCVLKRITPNPVLSPDPIDPSRRFPSLAEYLVSLARLRTFAPTLVYGGHGEPIHDYEELFNRYFRAIQERQTQVIRLVPKTGVTAWDVALEMFPDADDVHRFLSVSEAVAHLDLAHSEGKIAYELNGQREVYKPLT